MSPGEYISCETDERVTVPLDADGRVDPNDVTDLRLRLMLPKGTDVEDFCKRVYDAFPEVMSWTTNRLRPDR